MKRTLFLISLAACVSGNPPPPPSGPAAGPAPAPTASPQPPGVAAVTDEAGASFDISQGVPGDPAVVGCADGQREAFVDAAAFPSIAGCIGTWQGAADLRAARSGGACGDDLGECAAPVDACAPGWRVCGDSGAIADLSRVSADQCEQAGGGRFVAALSHCETQEGCNYDDAATGDYACFPNGWCSEPVCCGADCGTGVCPDGVWPGQTHIPVGTDQGCAAMVASRARGLLCCK